LTPSLTPTPSTTIFSNATFTYDGDGRRVKSVLTTNAGSTTTYFIGNHYEVVNGVVTKYYYAGTQRIAMRKNGTLTFILGDHLGSSSLVTDSAGTVINETQYKAWGETRYSSGTEQTTYTYTGQYSYVSDFGLQFYNARWYDSSLGRFAQADTIVPSGVQGLDRYAYVGNNPVRYTDPTGHRCEPGDNEPGGYCYGTTIAESLGQYGIKAGGLTKEKQKEALIAADNFGEYYYQEYGSQYGFTSSIDAFKKITGGNIEIILDDSRSDCITVISTITCDAGSMTMKAFVHEYFHVFDKYYQSKGSQKTEGCGGACLASSNLDSDYYTLREYTIDAYQCNDYRCVSHPDNPKVGPDKDGYYSYEAFANAGENLILGTLGIDLANNGFADTDGGRAVEGWMNDWMPTFLNGVLGVQQ
jgi:RHS repeat-associated protein